MAATGVPGFYSIAGIHTNNLQLDLTDPTIQQTIGDGGYQPTPHGNVPMGTTVVNVSNVEFRGGWGNDVVTGGKFDDSLNGGYGNDTLIGSPGTDYFLFDSHLDPMTNVDHIQNFTVASAKGVPADKIWLNDIIFTDLFLENISSDKELEMAFDAHIHEAANGDLTYNGILFAHLDGAPQLSYSNFQIYHAPQA
jgi:Ca2+-binding RTX toxin-like protein